MSDSVDRVFVHALNTVKRIPRTGTARPPTAERLKLYGLYKQSMEGDVEGVMDRPVGNTTDVYAECEKWDAWFAQRGLTRTDAKRRYISTLIDTMHQYASQTQEARELVDELEFVWDQIKANTSSGSESPMSSPVRTLGVPPLSPQHQQPPQQHSQRAWQHQQRTYASIGGRLAQQPAYEDMVATIANVQGNGNGNGNGTRGRGGGDPSRLRVLSPVSQPDDMYRRRSGQYGGQDEDDKGSRNQQDDDDEERDEEEEEEEEEYEEAQDNFDEDEDDDQNEHTTTNSNSHEDQTEVSSLQQQQHHGKDTPLMTPPPSNRKSSFSKKHPQPNSRRWRSRVEQALTKMTAEIAAVREQMETRAIQHRRRTSALAWIKWLTWITLRQVLWDLAVLAMLLIWMRIKGDRRIEDKLKAGWSELKGKLGRLRLGRQPRVGLLP